VANWVSKKSQNRLVYRAAVLRSSSPTSARLGAKRRFRDGHVAVVHKFLPSFIKRFFDRFASPWLVGFVGGSMYIRAEK